MRLSIGTLDDDVLLVLQTISWGYILISHWSEKSSDLLFFSVLRSDVQFVSY